MSDREVNFQEFRGSHEPEQSHAAVIKTYLPCAESDSAAGLLAIAV